MSVPLPVQTDHVADCVYLAAFLREHRVVGKGEVIPRVGLPVLLDGCDGCAHQQKTKQAGEPLLERGPSRPVRGPLAHLELVVDRLDDRLTHVGTSLDPPRSDAALRWG